MDSNADASDRATAATEDVARTLDRQAWAQQYRDPRRAAELGAALVAMAPARSAPAAQGHFHVAWAQWRWGSRDTARSAHAALREIVTVSAATHPELAALERDIAAARLRAEHRYDDALALLEANLRLPGRPAPAAYVSANGAALCCSALHRMDDALRHFHLALSLAHASADAALVANAAANLGGAHYDVFNLDDALRFCTQAFEHADAAGAGGAWVTSGINLALVLCALERHRDARAVVEKLRASGAAVREDKRAKYATVFAEVERGSGNPSAAQALLHDAAQTHAVGTPAPLEWVLVQAQLWNEQGRASNTRSLIEEALAAQREPNDDDLPLAWPQLHECAATACEAQQDFRAALQHLRAAARAKEALLGRSALARRIAQEVEHQLELARQQRDAAEVERQRTAQLADALREADLAKSRFLAAASHDLRQPIHALGLQLAQLQEVAPEGAAHEVALRMQGAVESLGSMFDTLLDISRMDAGVVAPRRRVLALRPLLARLADEFMPIASAKALRLGLRVPAQACTDSDPILLESMLRNLIANALKYTASGGVLLAVRRRDGRWRVQVCDTGPGIALADQERVFDEFYQVDNQARDRALGLGLGLAIVRRLARLLDHPVTLRSRPGHGSVFTLALPRSIGVAVQSAEPGAEVPARALRIAVIEDDAGSRESLAALLRQWGHVVWAASRVDELIALDGGPYEALDAVIADYRLNGPVTGDEQARQLLRSHARSVPVLIVTGDIAPERLRALAQGGLPWLSKPVQPARLRSWLHGVATAGLA